MNYPRNIREIFPRSAKLKLLSAVSYMGVPLMDLKRLIRGHLTVMNDWPKPEEPRYITKTV